MIPLIIIPMALVCVFALRTNRHGKLKPMSDDEFRVYDAAVDADLADLVSGFTGLNSSTEGKGE